MFFPLIHFQIVLTFRKVLKTEMLLLWHGKLLIGLGLVSKYMIFLQNIWNTFIIYRTQNYQNYELRVLCGGQLIPCQMQLKHRDE